MDRPFLDWGTQEFLILLVLVMIVHRFEFDIRVGGEILGRDQGLGFPAVLGGVSEVSDGNWISTVVIPVLRSHPPPRRQRNLPFFLKA